MRTTLFLISILLVSTAPPLPAQEGHGITPADLDRGGQIFLTNCANCHGPDGDSISGVNLASNRFRHAKTDADLTDIIHKGIAGTPMPPGNYTDEQARVIVAYLHFMATAPRTTVTSSLTGDIGKGRSIVTGKGQCLSCHRIANEGRLVAPDLSAIGAMRRKADIETSLLDPNAEIRLGNRGVRAVTREGKNISGTLLNQDTYSIQLLDSNEKLVSLDKSKLREFEVMKTSPMPAYKDKLSPQEVADAVAYLVSLKGESR